MDSGLLKLAFISAWTLAWVGVALWNAAKRDQPYWFVSCLVINWMGILPIFYLLILYLRDHSSAPRKQTVVVTSVSRQKPVKKRSTKKKR